MDLFYHAALGQRFQTVIYRGQRDRRHVLFCPEEHFGSGRVIALMPEHREDILALPGQSDPGSE